MAKRPTARAKQPSPEAVIESIISTADMTPRYSGSPTDQALIARGVALTIYAAASLNAAACSAQRMRLYRPSRGGSKSVWRGRKVTERKRLDWHYGMGGFQPSRKAMVAANDAGEFEEVLEHPIIDLLEHPDPYFTGAQWWRLFFTFRELAGRAYIFHGNVPSPATLILMYPQWTTIVASKSDLIAYYQYGKAENERLNIAPESVIYSREEAHPQNPLHAMSWLHSIVPHSDIEAAAVQSEINRWHQGGQPGMVFKVDPKVDPKSIGKVRSAINNQIRGVNKAGENLILQFVELMHYAAKPHEMNYSAGVMHTVESIYRAAKIPQPVWRMADSNKASATSADPQWMGYTILPKLNGVSEEFTRFLLPLFPGTEGWWFGYENPVKEDVQNQHARLKDMVLAGVAYPNEWRAAESLDPLPEELNVLRFNGTTIRTKAEEDAAAEAQARAMAMAATQSDEPGDEEAEDEESENEAEAPDDRPGGGGGDAGEGGGAASEGAGDESKGAGCVECQAPGHLPGHPVHAPFVKLKANGEQIIADFEAATRAWYERAIRGGVRIDGSVDVSPFMGELENIVRNGLRQVMTAEGLEALRRIGEPADVSRLEASAGITRYVQERGLSLATSVEGTLKDTVAARIGETVNAGGTIADAQRAVLAEAPQLSAYQAERLVRTESAFAQTEADIAVWSEAGWEGKEWVLSSAPCPACLAVKEKYPGPVPVKEPFVVDGKQYMGRDVHPQCDCDIIPVQELPK